MHEDEQLLTLTVQSVSILCRGACVRYRKNTEEEEKPKRFKLHLKQHSSLHKETQTFAHEIEMLNALFIISAMLYVDINMLMSSSRGRMLWTYDVCCKHPVPSVPLSNEGKHSEPSVDHNNGVVRCEGLYQASEGCGGPVHFKKKNFFFKVLGHWGSFSSLTDVTFLGASRL